MFTCYQVPMELIGGTKFGVCFFSSKSPQIYLTILYLSYIFIQLYLKILFVRAKGESSLSCAEQVKRFVVKILFVLVSWFKTKGLQREKLSVTAEVTKYHSKCSPKRAFDHRI